jgi:hypothetical protein
MYGKVDTILFPTFDLLDANIDDYNVLRYFKSSLEVDISVKHIRTFFRSTVTKELLPYRDKSIADFHVLNELYDYLYNGKAYPTDYMNLYMAGTKDNSFLSDRKRLFDAFRKGYRESGISFFESMPIPVECNDNGLNVLDGNHRASFIFKEGISKVPVVISKEGFEKFLNRLIGGINT